MQDRAQDLAYHNRKNQEGVDLIYPEGTYRFLFKDKKYSVKYGLIVEQMYRYIHNLDGKR